MNWEVMAALIPSALAVLASHVKLQSEVTRMKTRMEYLEEERSEMKTMLQDLCQMVNGSKATRKKYQSHLNILKVFAEEEGEELTWENMNGAGLSRPGVDESCDPHRQHLCDQYQCQWLWAGELC